MSDASNGTLKRDDLDPDLDENLVAEFLANNPDFFEYRLELLNQLSVPHPSGKSVSLIERQVASFRQENSQLKHKLSTLIANAQANETLLLKGKQLTLRILEARNHTELRGVVEDSMIADFGASSCALWLIGNDNPSQKQLSLPIAQSNLERLITTPNPFCGLLKDHESELLFRDKAAAAESAAIVPLYQKDKLVAILAIGNQDRDYYRKNVSTHMLSYIGDVISQMILRLSGKL